MLIDPFAALNSLMGSVFGSTVRWVPASQPDTPYTIKVVIEEGRPGDDRSLGTYMMLGVDPATAYGGQPLPLPISGSDTFILTDGSIYRVAQRESDVTGYQNILIQVRNRPLGS